MDEAGFADRKKMGTRPVLFGLARAAYFRAVAPAADDDGKEKVVTERIDLPPDMANGLVLTLLKNIPSSTPQTNVSMVATTPKPRLESPVGARARGCLGAASTSSLTVARALAMSSAENVTDMDVTLIC